MQKFIMGPCCDRTAVVDYKAYFCTVHLCQHDKVRLSLIYSIYTVYTITTRTKGQWLCPKRRTAARCLAVWRGGIYWRLRLGMRLPVKETWPRRTSKGAMRRDITMSAKYRQLTNVHTHVFNEHDKSGTPLLISRSKRESEVKLSQCNLYLNTTRGCACHCISPLV